ncbi:MAG: hypothetical protein IKR39_00355 [Lachnospiraceae bacterium]|nr:hypothetical protein [Lachnospiraceae bacterium]
MKKSKGNITGIEYFIVHACVETICFYLLRLHYPLMLAGAIAFTYDFFAFLPQGLIGKFIESHKKLPYETIGNVLMMASIVMVASPVYKLHVAGYIVLGIGNAIMHECGAIATVTESKGKIFPSALFVSGGGVGIVIGQTMGVAQVSWLWLIIPAVLSEVCALAARKSVRKGTYPAFDVVEKKFSPWTILIVAFVVTAVRSYLGYAIPISWNKELWQTIFLFGIMGLGKALGGYFVDRIGARKTAIFSTLAAIPFLVFGDKLMVVSVIGVFFFSMTMSITFAMCLSILKYSPGLAFGVTTAALFIGLVPAFFVRFNLLTNAILIVIFSIVCCLLLSKTLKK